MPLSRILRLSLIAAIFLSLSFPGFSQNIPAPRDRTVRKKDVIPVEILKIKKVNRNESIPLTGKAISSSKVDVTAKMDGVLSGLTLKEGDKVRKGQTLARLVQTDAEERLNESRNNMTLMALSVLSTNEELKKLVISLKAAKSRYELAKAEYEREAELLKKGYSSESTVSKLKADLDGASVAYESLKVTLSGIDEKTPLFDETVFEKNKDNLRKVMLEINFSDSFLPLELAKSRFVSAQNAYDVSLLNYGFTRPVAEIDGNVVSVNFSDGQSVKKNDVILKINNTSVVDAEFYLNEKYINGIHDGEKISVKLDSLPGNYDAVIREISYVPSQQGQTYRVTARIQNPSDKIKDGMSLRSSIVVNELSSVIMIPVTAVNEKFEGSFVYLNKNSVAKQVKVETGDKIKNEIQIISGIEENDSLIVKGWQFLQPEDPVLVKLEQ